MSEKSLPHRLASMDVYRGFVMFLMMAEVLEFCRVAAARPSSWLWQTLCWHQSHVEWVGCSLHDMIQPSFSFLVGAAMVFSMKSRAAAVVGVPNAAVVGVPANNFSNQLFHVLRRSAILVLLGIFLRSMGAGQTYFTFEDTLTQIGLGYPFLFLISRLSGRGLWAAFVVLTVGYWAAFALFPLPGGGFDWSVAGVAADWPHHLQGFAAHWNKNSNLAWAADRWFLNLFPTEKTFLFNEGGYVTLSFVPTLATMVLGLWAGRVLQSATVPMEKVKTFAAWGLGFLTAGLAVHFLGLCPIVKRIWTPAWVLWSGGGCLLFLAFFYWLVDIRGVEKPLFWLQVIGMNSIAAYVLAHTVIGFIHSSLATHLGAGYDSRLFGADFASLVRGGAQLLIQIWVLFWMWKRRLFIKI